MRPVGFSTPLGAACRRAVHVLTVRAHLTGSAAATSPGGIECVAMRPLLLIEITKVRISTQKMTVSLEPLHGRHAAPAVGSGAESDFDAGLCIITCICASHELQ